METQWSKHAATEPQAYSLLDLAWSHSLALLHLFMAPSTPSQPQPTILSGSFIQYIYIACSCHSTSPYITVLKGNKSLCAHEQKVEQSATVSNLLAAESYARKSETWHMNMQLSSSSVMHAWWIKRVSVFSSVLESCCSFIKSFIMLDECFE